MLRTLARVTADFRAAIEAAGADLWTAPHLGGSVPEDASFLDVVPLGRGALAVWTLGEELLVAPVVADGTHVRRAVAGDGVFTALADELGDVGGGEHDERSVGVD